MQAPAATSLSVAAATAAASSSLASSPEWPLTFEDKVDVLRARQPRQSSGALRKLLLEKGEDVDAVLEHLTASASAPTTSGAGACGRARPSSFASV